MKSISRLDIFRMFGFLLVAIGISPNLYAHSVNTHASTFYEGLVHPLGGVDHILAILSVGLWASQRSKVMHVIFPAIFIIFMLLAGWVGAHGIHLPFVEMSIAISAIALGILLMLPQIKISDVVSCALVALFAIFHGHAHGTELAHFSSWFPYAMGFAVSSLGICLFGLSMGMLLNQTPIKTQVLRLGGLAIAVTGCVLLTFAI